MTNLYHKLVPIEDEFLRNLKRQWFSKNNEHVELPKYLKLATEWFLSSRLINIEGVNQYPYADVIMGCTHYIESFILKYGWQGFQILEDEYAYYRVMGKHGVEVDQLEEGKPLIISLPNWKFGDIRPDFDQVLKVCEQRNIDIHIDMAWLTTAADISIDVGHPNVKSFAMSLSKYAMQWNRIGVRWTRQRTVDSVTIFNQYYGDVNTALASCGYYMMNNVPRDYAWDTYREKYYRLCNDLDLQPTKCIQVVRKSGVDLPYGIADLLVRKL